MKIRDTALLTIESLRRHRLRAGLSITAVAVGATAVLLLTTLGEAAKQYVVDQFAALGTNLIAVVPGRTETSGLVPAMPIGTRNLTLEDAEDLRRAQAVTRVAPFSLGAARVEYEERFRDVFVIGTTASYAPMVEFTVALGRFLPPGDVRRGEPVVVLGSRLRRELFGVENPLGKSVRIAGAKFRVIGVVEPKGQSLGIDFDDHAMIPVASALRLFNKSGLNRVLVQSPDESSIQTTVQQTRAILVERHREEDFTVITQDAMLRSFQSIINALTLALSAIAAISLAVAGIGIMNVMFVSVSERVSEVGLLKALGAHPRQIAGLFLSEALLLSGLGGVAGLLIGAAILRGAAPFWPSLALAPRAAWATVIMAIALLVGGFFGLVPARRAARLSAVDALRAKR